MTTLNDILGKITEADTHLDETGNRSFLTLTHKEVYDKLAAHGWEPPDDSTVELIALLLDEIKKLKEELSHVA